MEESIRLFTPIRRSITHSGAENFLAQIFRGEFSARTSQPRALLEETVHIGDRFRVGSAEFVVTQPRMPCFKLGIRFNRPDIVKRFLQSGRSGFYLAVLEEGEVIAGDSIELVKQDEHGVTVADIVNLYRRDANNQDLL